MFLDVRLSSFLILATILYLNSATVDVDSFLGTNPDEVLNSNSTYCANGISSLIVRAAQAATKFVNCKLFDDPKNLHNFLHTILSLPNATDDPIKSGHFVNPNLSSMRSYSCCITDTVPLDAGKAQQVEPCLLETISRTIPDLAYYENSFLVCMEATTGYARTNLISLTLIKVLLYYLLGIRDNRFEKDSCGLNVATASALLRSYEICRQTVENTVPIVGGN